VCRAELLHCYPILPQYTAHSQTVLACLDAPRRTHYNTMKHAASVMCCLLACLMLSGAQQSEHTQQLLACFHLPACQLTHRCRLPPLPAGCHAARPLAARQLLMWTGPSCSDVGGIGIGNAQALFMPGHNLVMGQVQLRNSGPRPFGFQSGGVKLAGPAGPLDCNLRCPQAAVPAGGSLQVRRLALPTDTHIVLPGCMHAVSHDS
jgi:hypothetical protein